MQEILQKLVGFKTISNDKEENKKAIEYVKSQLPPNLEIKEKSYNGHPTIVIGKDSPEICLQAHIDVVPAKESAFATKTTDGKMYGRGVYDMKFAIACYIKLLQEVDLSKANFGVMITSDEEVGGFNGVKKVLEDGYSPSFCLLPDGERVWNIDTKAKGAYHFQIQAKGKSGHASRPWEGDSAMHRLLGFLHELQGFFPKVKEDGFQNTLNVGVVNGGSVANQLAEDALAKIDIRFVSEEDRQKIEKKLTELQEKYGVGVKQAIYAPFFDGNTEDKHFERFIDICQKNNRQLTMHPSHATSDARFFSEKNIPTLVTRPSGGGSHSGNEWIDLEDLEVFYKILKDFVQ